MKYALVLLLALSASANTMYLGKNANISKDGKKIAEVLLLSPVSVLSENEKFAKVKISGFVNENYQEELVKSMSEREKFVDFHEGDDATFNGDKNPYITLGKASEDEYGEPWYEASMEFEVEKNALAKSADELYLKAKSLYEQTCSACHHLHATTEYTANQWPSNLESMISSGYVELSADEKALLIKYLQHHSKK